MPSFRDLLERRVPQYLAVYLGAGWGLIEFVSFLEERYAIAALWTDLLLLGWALFIPSVILFTYHHGRPGKDRWARSEKALIPLNALLVLIVLGAVFAGRASATTTTVTLTDETGTTIERAVARSEFRKRLAIFDFDAPAGDTSLAWLAAGASSLLASDLSQDIFLDMRVSAHFRHQLQEGGVEPGRAPPVALQRRIAEDRHLPYFVNGSVLREDGEIVMRAAVHETGTGEVLGHRTVRGSDVLAMIDELSVLIKKDLGLPRTQPGVVKDVPVGELLSTSIDAIRALTEGQAAILRDDWAAAEKLILHATELDPSFAFAHFGLYQVRALRGDAQGSLPSLADAMSNLYRMPERMQFLVKVEHFMVNREMDKAYAVATMMTEQYPDDLQGHAIRLQLQRLRNDPDAAIATLHRMLELDPQQQEQLLEVGRLQDSTGAYEDALRTYSSYATKFPQDAGVLLRIARTQQALGRLDQARATLERALLLDPTGLEVMVERAALLRNAGEFDAAWAMLEQARAAIRTPQDAARVHQGIMAYHEFRGQLDLAVEAGNQRIAALARYQPPITAISQRMSLLGLYVRAGRAEEAERILAEVREQMRDQIADFWRMGQLQIAIETRDPVQLHEGIMEVRRIIDSFGIHAFDSEVAKGEAVLAEVRGDWTGALRAYEKQKTLDPQDMAINRSIARSLRNLGRLDEAARAAEEHLRSAPMTPLTNLEAARIRLERGDRAGALQHLQRAARAWATAEPDYAPVAELRQLEEQASG